MNRAAPPGGGAEDADCSECGFDHRRWSQRDAVSFFAGLGFWWGQALAGRPAELLRRPPAAGAPSVLDRGRSLAAAIGADRVGLERVLGAGPSGDGEGEAGVVEGEAEVVGGAGEEAAGPAAVVAGVAREAGAMAALAGRDALAPEATALLHRAVSRASHQLMEVSRALLAAGAAADTAAGRVERINVSPGGVPKLAVASAAVGRAGVDGDRQANRKHHGRAFQAVCIWSADVISRLAAAGHPIGPGRAGENLTLSGLDWAALRPGTLLAVGAGPEPALIELSWPAVPCRHQAQWFTDGDYRRIAFETDPGAVRWYGWVRRPGQVAAGDPAVVSP